MWLLKNFIGNFSLKSGVYVSVLWNFLILMVFLVDEVGFLIAIIEIFFGLIMLFSLLMCPTSRSYYMAWMINKLALATIFGICLLCILIFAPFLLILIYFPLLAILCSLEIYFAMITYSMYYNVKHQHRPGIIYSLPTISKGPTNVNVPEVILPSGAPDIRSNPLPDVQNDTSLPPQCRLDL